MPAADSGIREKVLSALRWTAGARIGAQVITWAATLIVIRILSPEDYGLVAMAQVAFSLFIVFSSAGLGDALVQAKQAQGEDIRRIFGLLILLNAALFVLLVATAPAVGWFFEEPRVVPMVRTLGLLFFLMPFITISGSLLVREIDFRRKSLIDLAVAVLSSMLVLLLATLGFGVWALLSGMIAGVVIEAVGLALVRPYFVRPRFDFGPVRDHVRFGASKTGESIAWRLYSQADLIVAGRFFGTEMLGVYNVALQIASIPMIKVMPLLLQVAFPAFSRVHDTGEAHLVHYLLKALRVIAVIGFPVFFGIAAVAQEFVDVILGERWASVGYPLFLLSLVMPIRMLTTMLSPALSAAGHARAAMDISVAGMVLMPLAFLIGIRWGLEGLCLAWVFAYPLVFGFGIWKCCNVVSVTAGAMFAAIAPSAACAVLMLIGVTAARGPLTSLLPPWGTFLALVVIGAVLYVGLMALRWRSHLTEVLDSVRSRK